MSKEQTLKSPERRSFFAKAGIGVAGVAAVGLSGKTAKAATGPAEKSKSGGYRETEHVKQAYRTARF